MKKIDYKWTALALLWVAFFLQQGTRQLFGPSVPAICNSLGADKVAIGVVGTIFAMMYGICVLFAGIAADIFKRKWMVVAGVAIFCLGIYDSNFMASFFDVVNPRYHASGVGIMMCIAFLFGSLSSTVLPMIAKALGGNMSLSMSSLAAFYLFGALVILLARACFLVKDRISGSIV